MKRKHTHEKIKAARKRIKSHIRRKGEKCDFALTESFCLYWWHRLNSSVFDGKLTPPVRFELQALRGEDAGWCLPWRPNSKKRRVRIGITTNVWGRKEFLCILAHEMVHQWEWEILGKWEPNVAHGTRFFSWREKLKQRAGLPLETVY